MPASDAPDLFSTQPAPSAQPAVWPVSFLLNSVRLLLEGQIGAVWVAGEISGFTRAASGHCYFTLKDDKAQVRCTLWKHKAASLRLPRDGLRDGVQVEIRATPTLYEARGDFQLNVDALKLAGQGALYEKFLRMKAMLEAEGLFAEEKKRGLPEFPRGVALVTSAFGAALHDMLTTLRKRWPALSVVIYPTAVQGEGAAEQIALAIQTANRRARQDGTEVLIVARGGGSLEDLWAFNEEIVVRAIAASKLPVVSGVGHETDITLSDFAADVRAPTPTAAAVQVAPDGPAWRRAHEENVRRIYRAMAHLLAQVSQRVDEASLRLTHPQARIETQHRQTTMLTQRLKQAWQKQYQPLAQQLDFCRQRWLRQSGKPLPQLVACQQTQQQFLRTGAAYFAGLEQKMTAHEARLTLLNPQQVLARGYAIVSRENREIVRDASALTEDETLRLRFAKGEAQAVVKKHN